MNNKWKFQSDENERLKSLCNAFAPTSFEVNAQQIVAKECEKLDIPCWGDAIGNLYTGLNLDHEFRISIVAHIDEIGLQITEVTDQGLLRFRKLGGVRASSLIGHHVTILTNKGLIDGFVGCDPLQDNGTDEGILIKTADLWIDIAAEGKDQASKIVSIGDYVVFAPTYTLHSDTHIISKALDNRVGVFVMLEALRVLKETNLSIGVLGISSVQEELSMRGIAACRERMNAAIIVDVDFTTDIITDKAHTMGVLELGKGIGINRNADSNNVLQKLLIQQSLEAGFPIQTTLSRNISGGTDATKLQTNGNIATLNVNLPLRYMHTNREMCHTYDIECAINAVVNLIKYIDQNKITQFIPWK